MLQGQYGVKDDDMTVDLGHEFSECVAKCAEYHWIGMQSGDSDVFMIPDGAGGMLPNRHYGPRTIYDSYIGKSLPPQIQRARRAAANRRVKLSDGKIGTVLGPGFGIYIQWSKPNVGYLMCALKGGNSGRYFGVASDMPEDFIKQIHTYMPATKDTVDPKMPGFVRKMYLRQLSDIDHAFPTACQNLISAMRAGYFPMDFSAEKTTIEAA